MSQVSRACMHEDLYEWGIVVLRDPPTCGEAATILVREREALGDSTEAHR